MTLFAAFLVALQVVGVIAVIVSFFGAVFLMFDDHALVLLRIAGAVWIFILLTLIIFFASNAGTGHP